MLSWVAGAIRVQPRVSAGALPCGGRGARTGLEEEKMMLVACVFIAIFVGGSGSSSSNSRGEGKEEKEGPAATSAWHTELLARRSARRCGRGILLWEGGVAWPSSCAAINRSAPRRPGRRTIHQTQEPLADVAATATAATAAAPVFEVSVGGWLSWRRDGEGRHEEGVAGAGGGAAVSVFVVERRDERWSRGREGGQRRQGRG